jgi:hypothetical protein
MSRLVARASAVLTAAMIICVAPLAGCSGDDAHAVNSASVTRNAARLDSLYRRIMGTVAERTAGERLAYHRLQDPIQACATAAGLPDLRPPFVDIYAGRSDADLTVAFTGEGWLTPISTDSFGFASDQLRLSAAQSSAAPPPVERLSAPDRDRYQQIQDTCEPPAAAYAEVQFPPGAADLGRALDDVIATVEARSPVTDGKSDYSGCLRDAGFPDVGNPTALSGKLSHEFPPRDAMPLDGRAAGPAWTSFVARERKAARADARCRRGLYDKAVSTIGPDLDAFESAHAAELTAVRQGWAELVATAGTRTP